MPEPLYVIPHALYAGPGMNADEFVPLPLLCVEPVSATARRYRIGLIDVCADVPHMPACSHVSISNGAANQPQVRSYTPSAYGRGWFELVVESRYEGGAVSGHVARLAAGDDVLVRGPRQGVWDLAACAAPTLLLLAGGTGVAPMLQILRQFAAVVAAGTGSGPRRAVLLFSVRTTNDMLVERELRALTAAHADVIGVRVFVSQQPEEDVKAACTDATVGRIDVGAIRRCAGELSVDLTMAHCVVCGPPPFDGAMSDALESLEVADDRVSFL